ncbi:hypothetical protein IWW55_005554, partial [Coemansia sp. RSA 2706]
MPAPCSNQYYVGYVEDDESVDAIMKKFEELERIEKEFSAKKKAVAEGSGGADGAQVSTSSAPPADTMSTVVSNDADDSVAYGTVAVKLEESAAENGMSMEQLEE